ncbi:MAG: hypothetical protein OEW19_22245, partial [Acidobacteriota bacterium]|nr:hypothetical protein [Acidobacteriota bacterium]
MSEPAPIGQHRSAPAPWRTAHPTGEHLHQLAFHGHAEHVRALFEALTPAERARHADPEVLRQVVLGGLSRARALPEGAAAELGREREFIESVVELFVSECRSRCVFPRELARTLLDWSDELLRASRLTDAHDTCVLALTSGSNAFPEIRPWIQLRLARTQTLLGNLDAAHTTLLEAYRRLDRVADRNAVPALLDSLGTVSLQTRRAPLFTRLLVDRLRVFHTNGDERRAVVALMQRAHRGTLGLLASRRLSAADKLFWLVYWACLGAARHAGWRPVSRLFDRCATGSAYVRQYGLRSSAGGRFATAPLAIEATLVTRAMGGIGDLLMMTPGLRALKSMRAPRPVVMAIPRRFFPLFDGNDDVELMDIDDDFDPAAYREWF